MVVQQALAAKEKGGGELLPGYYQTDCNVFWLVAICFCSGAFTAKDVGRLNFSQRFL
jgi:hypothetical protein